MSIHVHILSHHFLICFQTIPPFVDLCALASPATFSFICLTVSFLKFFCRCFFCLDFLFVSLFCFNFIVFPFFLCSPCIALPRSCSAACLLWVCGAPPTFASFPSVFPSFLPPSFFPLGVCLSGDDHRIPKRRLL